MVPGHLFIDKFFNASCGQRNTTEENTGTHPMTIALVLGILGSAVTRLASCCLRGRVAQIENWKDLRDGGAKIIQKGIECAAYGQLLLFFASLDPHTVQVLHEASNMTLPGAIFLVMGMGDIAKGNYRLGSLKFCLGLSTLVLAFLHAYSVCGAGSQSQSPSVPLIADSNESTPLLANETQCAVKPIYAPATDRFLFTHADELFSKQPSPWACLGSGTSKMTFEHIGLPGLVIKKSARRGSGFRGETPQSDLIIDFFNLQRIQAIAKQFSRIVVPDTRLYTTPRGELLIIQESLEALSASWPDDPDNEARREAWQEAWAFLKETKLCDVRLEYGHNAHNLGGHFAFYDADCIGKGREARFLLDSPF